MYEQYFEPSNAVKFAASKGSLWAELKPRLLGCPEGKAFNLPFGDFTDNHLRSLVSRKAKAHGLAFRVIKHEGHYEIARIEQDAKSRQWIGKASDAE